MPSTKKPIRVLMVTGVYPTEQSPHLGTFIKSQVDSLVAAGVDVEIIHPKPGPVLLRYAIAIAQVFLKTLTGHFDVVHGHYGQWALIARMQWTTPVVASFLGSDVLGVGPTRVGGSKKGALITRISCWLCSKVDAVIVKSEEMKSTITGDHVYVIPNGVDFELFHPIPLAEARAALGWEQDDLCILFGNNPERPVKNFPLAQAAIERLRVQGVPAKLVVASGLPQAELVQYINASNALVLTSLSEGSPNVVKEAMACNVPVISTDVGDVKEIIGRTTGCRVCSQDPNCLAQALAETLQHWRPTTGRQDIAHLERSVIARRVIAVYEQVMSQKAQIKKIAWERKV